MSECDDLYISDVETVHITDNDTDLVVITDENTDLVVITDEDTLVLSDCVGIPGVPGPQGPAGPSGAGVLLTHDQVVPASVWIINHGFGRNCHVTLLIGFEEVMADIVQGDLNTVTVTWPYPIAGRAFLS